MANFKANRTEEDILREMTAILRELKDPRIDPMLTVVRAELSRDLSDCKIFVSSLSGKETAKESCKGLDSALRLYPAGTASPAEDPAESGTAFCGRRFDRT